jgi:hypothetical protein
MTGSLRRNQGRDVHGYGQGATNHQQLSLPANITPTAGRHSIVYVETALDRAAVCDVVDGLGKAFYHIPFAVCGVAAMVYYGYDKFILDRVSILCPSESFDVILCWARSRDMPLLADDPSSFGYRTAKGRVCAVRVRTQDSEDFASFGIVRLGPYKAPILSLPCVVNLFAKDYVYKLDNINPGMQGRYARDIIWMLERMAHFDSPEQRFTPKHTSWVLSRGFWLPFTLSYPEAIDAFSAAGLFICFGNDSNAQYANSARSDSSSPYDPAASAVLAEHYKNIEKLGRHIVRTSTASVSSPSRASASPTAGNGYSNGAPDVNKRLPYLPAEAHQPPLVPGQYFPRGFADPNKPLPPLPAEAFDVEPPIRDCKSFASRMMSKGKEKMGSTSFAQGNSPMTLVPAIVLTRDQRSPPPLRRVTQKLPEKRTKRVRFDSSADLPDSSRSTLRSTERYHP